MTSQTTGKEYVDSKSEAWKNNVQKLRILDAQRGQSKVSIVEEIPIDSILVDSTKNISRAGKNINPQDPAMVRFAQSIAQEGLLEPLVVRVIEPVEIDGVFKNVLLEAGYRRFCAVQILGWQKVPVTIRTVSKEVNSAVTCLTENLAREAATEADIASALGSIFKEDYSQMPNVATATGMRPEDIKKLLALSLSVSPKILAAWSRNPTVKQAVEEVSKIRGELEPDGEGGEVENQADRWEKQHVKWLELIGQDLREDDSKSIISIPEPVAMEILPPQDESPASNPEKLKIKRSKKKRMAISKLLAESRSVLIGNNWIDISADMRGIAIQVIKHNHRAFR